MKISKSENRNDFSEKKDFRNRKTKPTAEREKLGQKQTRKACKTKLNCSIKKYSGRRLNSFAK